MKTLFRYFRSNNSVMRSTCSDSSNKRAQINVSISFFEDKHNLKSKDARG